MISANINPRRPSSVARYSALAASVDLRMRPHKSTSQAAESPPKKTVLVCVLSGKLQVGLHFIDAVIALHSGFFIHGGQVCRPGYVAIRFGLFGAGDGGFQVVIVFQRLFDEGVQERIGVDVPPALIGE